MPVGSNATFGSFEKIKVCADQACNSPLAGASVAVNGSSMPYNPANGEYDGNLVIALGAAINLQVGLTGTTYSVSTTQVASTPTLDTPSAGTTWNAGVDNTATYHGGFEPRLGFAYVSSIFDVRGKAVYPASRPPAELPLTSTSIVIGKNWTTIPDTYFLGIGIATSGIGTGAVPGFPIPNAASGSSLWIGAFSSLTRLGVL